MEEWKEYTLGEIANIQTGPFGSQLHNKDYVEDGTPIVTVEHLGSKKFTTQNLPCVTSEDRERLKKYSMEEGDVIFSRVGSVDRCSYVDSSEEGWLFSGRCLRVRPSNRIFPLFLYYYLCQPTIKRHIRNIAVGATMPSINTQLLSEVPIKIPALQIQERIALILSSLDDKIELNRKINSNLEEQTKTIFQSWKKRIKELPHSSINLSEVARFIGGYSYKGNELQPSSQAMATIKNFERKGGFKVDGYKEIIPSEKIKQEQYAKVYDILVAHTDLTQNADVIGNAEMILSKGSHNRILFSMDLVKVEPKQNFPYRYFLIALLQDNAFKSHCLGYVNGTTVLHLSKKALPDFVFDIPTDRKLIEQINLLLSYYYQKRAEIMTESSDLASLRNVLLPRLMSGELVVR